MVARALSEPEKMRQVPGIYYMDGPAGRRAHLDGTGLDVWEVIRDYLATGRDVSRLAEGFHWLTSDQIETALAFYERFPDEIDDRLRQEHAAWERLFGTSAT